MPEVDHFICRMNLSNVRNFTDGKTYPATKKSGSDLCYSVKDDFGHQRFVLSDGSKSPHLVWWDGQKGPFSIQHSSGVFDPVYESVSIGEPSI